MNVTALRIEGRQTDQIILHLAEVSGGKAKIYMHHCEKSSS